MRVAHERARQLEAGLGLVPDGGGRRRKGMSPSVAATRKVAALVSGSSGDIDSDSVGAEIEEEVGEDDEEEEIAFGFVDCLSCDGDGHDSSLSTGEPVTDVVSSSSHALRPVNAQVRYTAVVR